MSGIAMRGPGVKYGENKTKCDAAPQNLPIGEHFDPNLAAALGHKAVSGSLRQRGQSMAGSTDNIRPIGHRNGFDRIPSGVSVEDDEYDFDDYEAPRRSSARETAHAESRSIHDRLLYFAQRPSPAFDNVVMRADYALRAFMSFYRFRRLGGGGEVRNRPIKTNQRLYSGVHYESDHPQVRVFALSVVALLVLFESAANAYFFSKQSELGLVGGMFQAMAVSLANVAVGYFIIGFWGMRHATVPWRHHWPTKLMGMGAIAVGLVLVLTVALSAAHFRNILDLRAEGIELPTDVAFMSLIPGMQESCRAMMSGELGQSVGGAATSALCRPMGLHSLDALVLFILSLTIAAIAAFEGRRSDAAFPGLSDATRQLHRARDALKEALDDYYESYDDVVEDVRIMLQEDDAGGARFTADDRIALYRALDERVARYRRLLQTSPDILRDEFALPDEVVDLFTELEDERRTRLAAAPTDL